jgi:hypothetical protein
MFRCNHCNTEYGGIRGISADKCPRCVARDGVAADQSSPALASDAPWLSPELVISRELPAPLVGAIAQLDRAARF